MCRQSLNWKRQITLFGFALAVTFLAAATAGAALKKYDVKRRSYAQWADASPRVEYQQNLATGVSVIEEGGANPVLKKLIVVYNQGRTTILPDLGDGFIWFNEGKREGPAPDRTGSGSTSSSIAWGNLSGWTITGATWCHAVPSYICVFGDAINLETVPTSFLSSNYDMGDWVFHGSGFTNPEGFVYRTAFADLGNQVLLLFGPRVTDGTVPVLPLLGIGAVGMSVLAMAVAAIRRR